MALRTLAKPPKNFFEVSKSLISKSSSKLAPAQNALSPKISENYFTSSFAPSVNMICANFSKISLGKELLFGVPKVISADFFYL
jgi:hypothetical protein